MVTWLISTEFRLNISGVSIYQINPRLTNTERQSNRKDQIKYETRNL
jgi:hypothetical protein